MNLGGCLGGLDCQRVKMVDKLLGDLREVTSEDDLGRTSKYASSSQYLDNVSFIINI